MKGMHIGSISSDMLCSIHRLELCITVIARSRTKNQTINNKLRPKNNIDHVYIPRKVCGRGLQGIEETVNLTNLRLENYVREVRGSSLTAARSVETVSQSEKLQQAKKQEKVEGTISWEGQNFQRSGESRQVAMVAKWISKV